MARPDIQQGSKVKVVDKKSKFWRWRGVIESELTQCSMFCPGESDVVGFVCKLSSPDGDQACKVALRPEQVACIQKKFIDIEHIREDDLVIGKKEDGTDAVRLKNTGAFAPGDIIQVTTKIDGANASVAWNDDEGKLEVFSRTNLLDQPDDLRGFVSYVKTEVEPKANWKKLKKYSFFGEWCIHHTCNYDKSWFNKWRVYDIWDKDSKCWLLQDEVKKLCNEIGLLYVEELYYGPFISWDHCRSFLSKSTAYGPEQEGIVIKNQTKLNDDSIRAPKYLKIVNEAFKESQHSKKAPKERDPAEEAEKDAAREVIESVVTEARVRKTILKLVDEGKLPAELKPTDMRDVMKLLPKLVFEDLCKEEPEALAAAGKHAGKCVGSTVAAIARKIVIGY